MIFCAPSSVVMAKDVDVMVAANGTAPESRERTAVWSRAGSIGRF